MYSMSYLEDQRNLYIIEIIFEKRRKKAYQETRHSDTLSMWCLSGHPLSQLRGRATVDHQLIAMTAV